MPSAKRFTTRTEAWPSGQAHHLSGSSFGELKNRVDPEAKRRGSEAAGYANLSGRRSFRSQSTDRRLSELPQHLRISLDKQQTILIFSSSAQPRVQLQSDFHCLLRLLRPPQLPQYSRQVEVSDSISIIKLDYPPESVSRLLPLFHPHAK